MRKVIIFAAGLAVVGAGLYFLLAGTKGNHLDLTGKILKVRVVSLSPQASLVVADFRVTDPSTVPFVVESVSMRAERPAGEPVEGRVISKSQMDNVFQALKLVGPKYNDILTLQDRIAPHQTMDRMVAARFEVPASVVESRKALWLRIDDVDGASAEITEGK